MVEPYELPRLAPSPAHTAALARALAGHLRIGDVIGLTGVLGAGKTAFARALIHRLGEPGPVPSPTFTLVQIYDSATPPLWHFDLYRIDAPEEVYELGIEDAFADAITLIEWPRRLCHLTPADWLEVRLDPTDDHQARRITLRGHGAWAPRLQSLAHVL